MTRPRGEQDAHFRRITVGGVGTSVDRLAVAWVLANPAVDVAIVGTRNLRHVDDAVAAAELRLDAAAMNRIEEVMRPAVPVGGPSEGMPQESQA